MPVQCLTFMMIQGSSCGKEAVAVRCGAVDAAVRKNCVVNGLSRDDNEEE